MFPECSGNYNLCNKEEFRDLNICIDIESIPFQEVPLSITQYVEDLRNLYFQGRWTKQKKETPWEMSEVNISTLPKNNLGQFYNFYSSQFFSFTLVYNPLLALVFVTVYWIIGLFHAYFVWNHSFAITLKTRLDIKLFQMIFTPLQ